jgi:hypothetical protein
MIIWLAVIALVVVLIYLSIQRRQEDAVWLSFRRRRKEKRCQVPPDQPLDPNFQFDQPADNAQRDKSDGSN